MKTQAINRRIRMLLVAALWVIAALPALSASKMQQQDPQTATNQSPKKNGTAAPASDGEKKFKQNCSRCHEAPQTLSPHISGTILRHMRVRASLSQQDERDILKFLNP